MGYLYAISDLHVDFKENMEYLNNYLFKYKNIHNRDVIIICGDISNKLILITETLNKYKECFKEVFYIYGNHDLWENRKEKVSTLDKIFKIESFCFNNNIHMSPFNVEDVCIVPVYSWYDKAFANIEDLNDPMLEGWMDYYLCQFEKNLTPDDIVSFFLKKNEDPNKILSYGKKVVSFSHFIPRIELLPIFEERTFKGLSVVSGSPRIEDYIRSVQSSIHISGHMHVNFDVCLDNVRYLQNSWKYPTERFKELPEHKRILKLSN